MTKKTKPIFTLQLPLQVENYQIDVLNKRMEIGRRIYNSLANITLKRFKEMTKTKVYRKVISEIRIVNEKISNCAKTDKKRLKSLESQKKQLFIPLNDLRKAYRISEYDFHADVAPMQKRFKKHIDSHTAQKIATQLWKAYDSMIFGEGDNIHFKKYGNLNSLEGKTFKTGIRYKEGFIEWNKLKIKVIVDKKNPYEVMAFENKMKYCRIIRKFVRGKYKFYVQLVFEGFPPPKYKVETGELKHTLGTGAVGLDIGTQTLAISSKTSVKLVELADRVQNIEDQKRRIQRKMDRSRRSTNPDNYNVDGTIKKQGSKKVIWTRSKRYTKLQGELKEIQRKQTDVRKLQHEQLANEVIALGEDYYVEQMSFKGLQKRAKNTTINEKTGRFHKKKRFGKSLANKAPSMFLDILARKLKYQHRELNKINTHTAKASQYNHHEDNYKKKKLSKRWDEINGFKVQRDMYSAFLIMNIKSDLKTIDKPKCEVTFNNFLHLHDIEVQHLTGKKNLSSIAI